MVDYKAWAEKIGVMVIDYTYVIKDERIPQGWLWVTLNDSIAGFGICTEVFKTEDDAWQDAYLTHLPLINTIRAAE